MTEKQYLSFPPVLTDAQLRAAPVPTSVVGAIGLDAATLEALETTNADSAREVTLQAVRDRLDVPIEVNPRVAGALISGTNPLPVAGVFSDHNGVPFSGTNPLPVSLTDFTIDNLTVSFPNSLVSDTNSTSTPLLANEEFTGTWTDILQYAAVQVVILVDQPSATNGAMVEFSDDSTLVLRRVTATIPANTGLAFTIPPQARYMRLRYLNGATAQGLMRAQTLLSYQPPAASTLPVAASTTDVHSAQVTQAHLKGRFSTGAWVPLASTATGALSVSSVVTNFPAVQPVSDNGGSLTTDGSYDERYSGGKSAYATTITAAGDTTLVTPAAGKLLRVVWVLVVPNPDNLFANRVRFKFGAAGAPFYEGYALAHWEIFNGAVDEPLVLNTQNVESVSVTVHYREITP